MGLSSSRYGLLVAYIGFDYMALQPFGIEIAYNGGGSVVWSHGGLSESLFPYMRATAITQSFLCFSFDHDTFFGGHFECDDTYTQKPTDCIHKVFAIWD